MHRKESLLKKSQRKKRVVVMWVWQFYSDRGRSQIQVKPDQVRKCGNGRLEHIAILGSQAEQLRQKLREA